MPNLASDAKKYSTSLSEPTGASVDVSSSAAENVDIIEPTPR